MKRKHTYTHVYTGVSFSQRIIDGGGKQSEWVEEGEHAVDSDISFSTLINRLYIYLRLLKL